MSSPTPVLRDCAWLQVSRFRQQQRVWVRERQRMAAAAQRSGISLVDKERLLEKAAATIDKMQRE